MIKLTHWVAKRAGGRITINAQNKTGTTLHYGDCVAIEGLAKSLADKPNQQFARPIIKAQFHTPDLDHSVLGACISKAEDNQPGTFIVAGTAWVRVDISDADHHFVKLPDDQTDAMAESGTEGYPIIDQKDDTGPTWALIYIGGAGGGGAATDIRIVLIDKDIDPGALEDGRDSDHPSAILDEDHFVLTNDEVESDTVVTFQDPVPDDDTNYNDNIVGSLNLWAYERKSVDLKYYHTPSKTQMTSGTAQDGGTSTSIKLADGASTMDDRYNNAYVTVTDLLGAQQTRKITSYVGSELTATVSSAWDITPDSSYTYVIEMYEPGYDPDKTKLTLATVAIDDPDHDPPRKIVRYATTSVIYDDDKIFPLEEYIRDDYPDYPENELFPPDGTGTYEETPDGFFKKRYRGIAINGVLITALCKELPPPIIPLAE